MAKRAFDVIVAAIALVVLAPVLAAAAVAVRLSSPGPILHRSQRVARGGATFTLLKFRSMLVAAARNGPGVTADGDPRITRIGRVLRATKLDELPQLWNVLRGDMSLVGPRPEDPRYVQWYTPAQRMLLDWRPGITSPASVTFRDEERILAARLAGGASLDDAYRSLLQEKLALDLDYFPRASLRADLHWLARTVSVIAHRSAPS